jgi:polyisoprenoid-binding protein YceI
MIHAREVPTMRRLLLPAASAAAMVLAGAPRAAAPATAFTATAFTADAGSSRLEFTGVQAGAPFKGSFRKFSATVDFSPDALADAHFDVVVDMVSEDSGDKDRDDTMHGADMFDVAHFPTAHYVTKSFAKTASGYTALGSLTLHGVTRDVPIAFTFAPNAAGASLSGTADLKRLDFGVGRGDWKSTQWVGDAVKVAFSLNLKPRS